MKGRIHINTADEIKHQLESFRSQLQIVKSQGKTVNNGAAKTYLEKKIRELLSKLPPSPPPPAPVDTKRSAFEKLFRD